MRELTAKPDPGISASQLRLAAELHITDAQTLSTSELIAAIEGRLGERTVLECARWFLMSVLRHERQALWSDPDHSDISRENQNKLARDCLAKPEFVQSIKTVLKGDSCKYALVEFRRTRNPRKHILANTTVAYQCALGVLRKERLLEVDANPEPEKSAKEQPPASSVDVTTTNMRRASRRGFGTDATRQDEPDSTIPSLHGAGDTAHTSHDPLVISTLDTSLHTGLTPQEYAELEQALSQPKLPISSHKPWRRFGDDERRSWLLGLLAGFAAFAAILFLFF